ncbi:MAG: DUF4912 domain-containing protein [Treponema sp.]|jgi:hypothetical protein|nr:DUF4912 domain-containing protein [Treponema sp.]
MNDNSFTRSNLESLTTDELVGLADLYGTDIPPGLDRLFLIEELLEIASEKEGEEEEGPLEGSWVMETGFLEPVPLPKQYNITFIAVMIRDPLWAFAFWEVKESDKEVFEKAPDFGGYYLKVSPWEESRRKFSRSQEEGAFTVPVETGDTARYLGFPLAGEAGSGKDSRFKVELCARRGADEVVLALSSPFRLPPLPPTGAGQEENRKSYQNPLISLSGSGDFHILRNLDRLSRPKKGGNPLVR